MTWKSKNCTPLLNGAPVNISFLVISIWTIFLNEFTDYSKSRLNKMWCIQYGRANVLITKWFYDNQHKMHNSLITKMKYQKRKKRKMNLSLLMYSWRISPIPCYQNPLTQLFDFNRNANDAICSSNAITAFSHFSRCNAHTIVF